MLTVLLFVAVLFNVLHVENLVLCTYLAFALVIRLYNSDPNRESGSIPQRQRL